MAYRTQEYDTSNSLDIEYTNSEPVSLRSLQHSQKTAVVQKMDIEVTTRKRFELLVPPVRCKEDLLQKQKEVDKLLTAFSSPIPPNHGGNLFYVLYGPSGSGKRVLANFACSGYIAKTDYEIRHELKEDYFLQLSQVLHTNQDRMQDDKITAQQTSRFTKPQFRNNLRAVLKNYTSDEVFKRILAEAKVPTDTGR